jgi:hypothetical protein
MPDRSCHRDTAFANVANQRPVIQYRQAHIVFRSGLPLRCWYSLSGLYDDLSGMNIVTTIASIEELFLKQHALKGKQTPGSKCLVRASTHSPREIHRSADLFTRQEDDFDLEILPVVLGSVVLFQRDVLARLGRPSAVQLLKKLLPGDLAEQLKRIFHVPIELVSIAVEATPILKGDGLAEERGLGLTILVQLEDLATFDSGRKSTRAFLARLATDVDHEGRDVRGDLAGLSIVSIVFL